MDAYQLLAEKHGYGHSKRYRRILEFLMTPKQSEIVASLPASFEAVASNTGINIEEVRKEIDILFRKGVIIPKDFKTLEGARFCPDVMRLHDATEGSRLTAQLYGERAPEFWALWEDFCQEEYYADLAREASQKESPATRILPAFRAIENIPGVTIYDDIRETLKAAKVIAVDPCSCRTQARKTDVLIEGCLQFNRGAEYAVARGSGRQIDYGEAMEIVEKLDEDGAIHRTWNWRSLGWGVMCSCTKDACTILTPLFQYGELIGKRVEKSRFEAAADQSLCNGCQICVDRCQFDAIEMVKSPGSKKYKAIIRAEKCWGCGVCVVKCEPKALSLKLVRPIEYIPEEKPSWGV
jgi:ferredoxin